jgi:hypothetical protein
MNQNKICITSSLDSNTTTEISSAIFDMKHADRKSGITYPSTILQTSCFKPGISHISMAVTVTSFKSLQAIKFNQEELFSSSNNHYSILSKNQRSSPTVYQSTVHLLAS